MFGFNKRNSCTNETTGVIYHMGCEPFSKGNDFRIKVSYKVSNKVYSLQEPVVYKTTNQIVKWGNIPVARSCLPVLGPFSIGTKVRVKYDPNHPKNAYLVDNVKI